MVSQINTCIVINTVGPHYSRFWFKIPNNKEKLLLFA